MISVTKLTGGKGSVARLSSYLSSTLQTDRERPKSADNYYAQEAVEAEWFGKLSSSLRLDDRNIGTQFSEMLQGKFTNNLTGELTEMARRPSAPLGWDFTISAPKSVSIAALVCADDDVKKVHDYATARALEHLELWSATRVRHNGSASMRVVTESVSGALFKHETNRANEPDLHTHCVIFNFTPIDNRYGALETKEMYRQVSAADRVYKSHLTQGLRSIGYNANIRKKDKHWDVEIEGINKKIINHYSSRTQKIADYKSHRDSEIQRKKDSGLSLSASEQLSLIHISEPTRPY